MGLNIPCLREIIEVDLVAGIVDLGQGDGRPGGLEGQTVRVLNIMQYSASS